MQLQVSHVHAQFQRKVAVHDVSFDVEEGSVTAIVGPNGCGKSTLLRTIARLHRPTQGKICVDNKNIWQLKNSQMAKILSLLPQYPVAPEGLTVFNLVQFGRYPYQGVFQQWQSEDEKAVMSALEATSILDLADRPVNSLSGGQRQRAWLAMTLAQETPLVLLDEPTSALDIGHQVEVLKLIKSLSRQQGRSFLVVLHDLFSAARYADQLLALREGKLMAIGRPETVITPTLIAALYDIDADVIKAPVDHAPLAIARP